VPQLRLQGGEVDGLLLNYVVEGRGPAVTLVHGLGGFAESWRPTIAGLAARTTVHAVDLPGFGRAGKPLGRYDLRFFASALHRFHEALGLGTVALVGHSLGGAVALTYALTHPLRVDRLALVGALVPGFDYRPAWIYRLLAVRGLGEAMLMCGSAAVYKAALARCFHVPRPEDVDFLVDTGYGERTCWEAKAAFLATVRGVRDDLLRGAEGYRRAIATLDVPVLLIHGCQDRVIRSAHCREAARAFPRATLRLVEGCGHFPHIEHAGLVNEWLEDFVTGRPAPR
jgi:pimeloyl-ACP methyl ester carboxylesterase